MKQFEITHFEKLRKYPPPKVAEQERNDEPLIETFCSLALQETASPFSRLRCSKI
jgi:hypothetical protein